MDAINFDQLFNDLKDGVITIAKDTLHEYENEAKADGQKLIDELKENLQQWAKEIEAGTLTSEDLRYLLDEEKDLSEMVALKQAGLAEVRIDEFRNNIINMVVSTVTGLIRV
jgi:Holliday junction resolvasome RuvABC DNA-binding subunit